MFVYIPLILKLNGQEWYQKNGNHTWSAVVWFVVFDLKYSECVRQNCQNWSFKADKWEEQYWIIWFRAAALKKWKNKSLSVGM